MVRTFAITIWLTRKEMQDQLEKEDMTGKFTPEEDRCYKTCYDLLHTFVENRRVRKVAAEAAAAAARSESWRLVTRGVDNGYKGN